MSVRPGAGAGYARAPRRAVGFVDLAAGTGDTGAAAPLGAARLSAVLAAGQAHLRTREAASTGAPDGKPGLKKQASDAVAIPTTKSGALRPPPPAAPPPPPPEDEDDPPQVKNWVDSGGLKRKEYEKTQALAPLKVAVERAKKQDKECSAKEDAAMADLRTQMQKLIEQHKRDEECGNKLAEASEALLKKTESANDEIVRELAQRLRDTHALLDKAQAEKSGDAQKNTSRQMEMAQQIKSLQQEIKTTVEKHTAATAAAKAAADKAIAELKAAEAREIQKITAEKSKVEKELAEKNKECAKAETELAAESSKLKAEIADLQREKAATLGSSEKARKDLEARIAALQAVEAKITQIEKVLYPNGKPCDEPRKATAGKS